MVTTALVHAAAVALAVVTLNAVGSGRDLSEEAAKSLDLFAASAVIVTVAVLAASFARLFAFVGDAMAWLNALVAFVAAAISVVALRRELTDREVEVRLERAITVHGYLSEAVSTAARWRGRHHAPWWLISLLMSAVAFCLFEGTLLAQRGGNTNLSWADVVIPLVSILFFGAAGAVVGREIRLARIIKSRERATFVVVVGTVLALELACLLLTIYVTGSWSGVKLAVDVVILPFAFHALWAQRKGALVDPLLARALPALLVGQEKWRSHCKEAVAARAGNVDS